ncbi:MAG: hypothetical protein INR73_18410 [Williamsia sp.]|nr:hypothetical protein [Williamsia sp.]
MGYTTWSSDMYDRLRSSYTNKTGKDIFSSHGMSDNMSPFGVRYRESRDSAVHPQSLAVQVYLDVTGSMGRIPEVLVKQKLGSLMNTLMAHGIEHPQILFGAIGDHQCDRFPLQVGQFESGTEELNRWLTETYLEGGGGGQHMESYLLAWWFAARHTATDCFEKRGQKGFVFTIGDEWTWNNVDPHVLQRITGMREKQMISAGQVLQEAMYSNHVFHIHVNEGSYRNAPMIIEPWKALLGERLISLDDHRAVAETIASTVAVLQGVDLQQMASSFDAQTAQSVVNAVGGVKKGTRDNQFPTIYLK